MRPFMVHDSADGSNLTAVLRCGRAAAESQPSSSLIHHTTPLQSIMDITLHVHYIAKPGKGCHKNVTLKPQPSYCKWETFSTVLLTLNFELDLLTFLVQMVNFLIFRNHYRCHINKLMNELTDN